MLDLIESAAEGLLAPTTSRKSGLDILSDYPLQSRNTLALPARAVHYCEVQDSEQLGESLVWAAARGLPVSVLGGGSNVVLQGTVPGLVIRMATTGIHVVAETDRQVTIRVAAGENWHALVEYSLARGWFGLENLALIPGNVGAAPIQNIGAYGVELSRFLESVTLVPVAGGEPFALSAADCRPGYRDSIFKHELKGRVVIVAVTLRLEKVAAPVVEYPALAERLASTARPTPTQVAAAVCALRREKLPDPARLPNAGSFFKNPVLDGENLHRLMARYPDMPWFALPGSGGKVPAAWLIDRAGWKGYRSDHVGVHERQALVLVHFGGGNGEQVLALARRIADDVERCFGVRLEMEPTVMGHAGD